MAFFDEVDSIVHSPADSALYIQGREFPFSSLTPRASAEKTDVTGSTSTQVIADETGAFKRIVVKEWGEGDHTMSVSIEGHFRVGAAVAPPNLREGATYACQLFRRRPLTQGAGDPGRWLQFNLFIDDWELGFDPKAGSFPWRLNATVNGPWTWQGTE